MADNKNKIDVLDFDDTDVADSIIKVIGVGGGGGNAVNHMYREGIHEVTFVLCNTDAQALNDSPVPVHLQLGKEGLGAGNRPGGHARQQKTPLKTSSVCSMTVRRWHSSQPAWGAEPVRVQHRSLRV
ncbi:Cell division protein FtsZ [Prevotella denticola]|uniref:Cell division protein FtsZ n=1 Tax=Prevotella denticola TaxID=28129 RepID=A0A379E5V2_9BACT|nr:Cell division protein FtsZ [Prevotella denticola]